MSVRASGLGRLALWLALASTEAAGHQLDHPKSEELSVLPGGVALLLRYQVEPGDAARSLRARADLDQNGQLDPKEAEQLYTLMSAEALSTLVIRMDERRLTLSTQERHGDGAAGLRDRNAELSLSLLLRAEQEIAPGLHVIELRDRGPRLGTTVSIEARFAPGLEPLLTSHGSLDYVTRSLAPFHLGNGERLRVVFVRPD